MAGTADPGRRRRRGWGEGSKEELKEKPVFRIPRPKKNYRKSESKKEVAALAAEDRFSAIKVNGREKNEIKGEEEEEEEEEEEKTARRG